MCPACVAMAENSLACAVCGLAGEGELLVCDACDAEAVHLACLNVYDSGDLRLGACRRCARDASIIAAPAALSKRLARATVAFKPGTSDANKVRCLLILLDMAGSLARDSPPLSRGRTRTDFLERYVVRRNFAPT